MQMHGLFLTNKKKRYEHKENTLAHCYRSYNGHGLHQ